MKWYLSTRALALVAAALTAACSTNGDLEVGLNTGADISIASKPSHLVQLAVLPDDTAYSAAAEQEQIPETAPIRDLDDVEFSGTNDFPIEIDDPLEGFNRGVYRFNAEFDRLVFQPVLSVYDFVLPEFAKDGISNFFTNLGNFITFGNELLQLKPIEAGQTAFRFAINITFGALGFFDAASEIDVPKNKEDFGQTLGHYGVGPGPYLVLPILGPSNIRDATGFAVDTVAFATIDPFQASSFQTEYPAVLATNIINQRREVPFEYYETGSPFEYDFVRYFYTRKREFEIAK